MRDLVRTTLRVVTDMGAAAPSAKSTFERDDWLLLLIDRDALEADSPKSLDPVRIQKGLFLLSMRGPARDLYSFIPYSWGPFSREVYRDLDGLVAKGLLRREPVPGQNWVRYSVTETGHERAQAFAKNLSAPDRDWLARVRRYLTDRSFGQLLREIYDAYPQYATRSRLSR
jgi:hypothetical protein